MYEYIGAAAPPCCLRCATARGDDWLVEFLAVTMKWFTLIKLRKINEEVSNVFTQKTMLIYLIEKASEK